MSGADFVSHFTILYDDCRVAVYKDNNLWDFSKPDYLDVETLINVLPRLGYSVALPTKRCAMHSTETSRRSPSST